MFKSSDVDKLLNSHKTYLIYLPYKFHVPFHNSLSLVSKILLILYCKDVRLPIPIVLFISIFLLYMFISIFEFSRNPIIYIIDFFLLNIILIHISNFYCTHVL